MGPGLEAESAASRWTGPRRQVLDLGTAQPSQSLAEQDLRLRVAAVFPDVIQMRLVRRDSLLARRAVLVVSGKQATVRTDQSSGITAWMAKLGACRQAPGAVTRWTTADPYPAKPAATASQPDHLLCEHPYE